MAQVHAAGGWVLLAAVWCFLVAAFVFARLAEPRPWVESARKLVIALVAVQVALGLVAYGGGRRPGESLHLLYGAALLGVFPLAGTFAAEAPPRARSGVMVIGALVSLALVWRLFATG